MDGILAGLRAAAEPTRLRLLALCAQGDLTVSDLTHILGQSQPRVSRHLRIMCEAGLLDRWPEGAWVLYRLAQDREGAEVARRLIELLPAEDETLRGDSARLEDIKRRRGEQAAAYFRANAGRWDSMRSLCVDDGEVEAALLELLAGRPIRNLLDIGTGTGRIIEILGPHAAHAVGVDLSREMLAVARSNLDRAELRHCLVRQADMYRLPFPNGSFDVVTVHQVLHYAEQPQAALAEAARVLAPGGRLAVVDFAPHDVENLRTEHRHRRLGFGEEEVNQWLRKAGLDCARFERLPGDPLTVTLWLAVPAGRRNSRQTGVAA